MNRTHWIKTAAGLGAACFITIGMNYTGAEASANTNALDNYFIQKDDVSDTVALSESADSILLSENYLKKVFNEKKQQIPGRQQLLLRQLLLQVRQLPHHLQLPLQVQP